MGGMGGQFRLSEKAIEPLGECKNDIEIILELAKRLGLEDEVLGMNYEEYMDKYLKPSGLTSRRTAKTSGRFVCSESCNANGADI